jgi:hypothetical protein
VEEKLKLSTNVPVEIALKYNEGKEYTGEYGDSVLFTLTDGRRWFAPTICAKKIQELGVAAGEVIRVCKAETQRGNRRAIEWQITRVVQQTPAQELGSAVAPAGPIAVPPAGLATASNDPTPRGQEIAVTSLTRCFGVAIDSLLAARQIAAERGLDLKFNEGNVISVAMSVYINATKEAKSWAA